MLTLTQISILAAESTYSGGRIVLGMVIGGAIGGLIGNRKDRIALGVVLGAFLGCIGWIIMAAIPRKKDRAY